MTWSARRDAALAALYATGAAYSVAFRQIADALHTLDDADAEPIRQRIHSIDRQFHELGSLLRKAK